MSPSIHTIEMVSFSIISIGFCTITVHHIRSIEIKECCFWLCLCNLFHVSRLDAFFCLWYKICFLVGGQFFRTADIAFTTDHWPCRFGFFYCHGKSALRIFRMFWNIQFKSYFLVGSFRFLYFRCFFSYFSCIGIYIYKIIVLVVTLNIFRNCHCGCDRLCLCPSHRSQRCRTWWRIHLLDPFCI